ncbi:hypothetical protein B0J13DRAFT_52252 [Dactylonectria estremocensis]|uniref:Uncharacterized protein n=1 Tax=Dactylonectria estremocensis TaxID=1079267 RepID=A0A9P9EKG8_9HYPO|nr:hypothetical protein B0J13DRAFT_52252 [Dactylonectria estremocensis]
MSNEILWQLRHFQRYMPEHHLARLFTPIQNIMTDPGWLRFLGGTKSRAARTLSSPRSEPVLRMIHHTNQAADESHVHHRKDGSRLSSWHGFMKPTSLAAGMNDEQANNVVGGGDITWHNPSMEQMVDALRVAMMTKSVLEPLSKTYHSHIVHLIEGYSLLQANVNAVQQELVSMEALRQGEIEAYRAKQEFWMVQEARYKAEIKRLELVIHQTSDNGLEAVMLARSGSLLRPVKHISTKPKGSDNEDGRDDGTEKSSGSLLGRHNYFLSRPRMLDTNREVRLSRRFREKEDARSLRQNRACEREKQPDIHTKACQATSGSGSSGAGGISLHEDAEGSKEPENVRPSPDGRVSPRPLCGSASQKFGPGSKAPRAHHRREFSFAPGDDVPTVPSLSMANTALGGLERVVMTRATSGRSHGRSHGRI